MDGIADGLRLDAPVEKGSDIVRAHFARGQGQLLGKPQGGPKPIRDGRGVGVVDGGPDYVFPDFERGDRLVKPRSEGALVASRHQRREQLALAERPVRRATGDHLVD